MVSGNQPGYRQGSMVSVQLSVTSLQSQPYRGPLQVVVLKRQGDVGSKIFSQFISFNQSSSLSFPISEAGQFDLMIMVSNNVSSTAARAPVVVATVGQYSYVRLIFSEVGVGNPSDPEWQTQLQIAVRNKIVEVSQLPLLHLLHLL